MTAQTMTIPLLEGGDLDKRAVTRIISTYSSSSAETTLELVSSRPRPVRIERGVWLLGAAGGAQAGDVIRLRYRERRGGAWQVREERHLAVVEAEVDTITVRPATADEVAAAEQASPRAVSSAPARSLPPTERQVSYAMALVRQLVRSGSWRDSGAGAVSDPPTEATLRAMTREEISSMIDQLRDDLAEEGR